MSKRFLSLLLALVVLCAAAMSGCTQTQPQTDNAPAQAENAAATEETKTPEPEPEVSEPAEPEPEPEPEPVAEAPQITYLDPIPTPERTAMLQRMISEFNASGKGVCEYQSIPWDEAFKKIVTMAASNTLPDVISLDEGIMRALVSGEYLEPLDDWFDNGFPYKDDLSPTFVNSTSVWQYENGRYMIPDSFGCQGIFIRSDWLEEAGIDIETLRNWTWDQYFEVIEKLTDKDKNRYGIAFRGGPNGMRMFFEYACSNLEVGGCFPDGNSASIYERPEMVDLFIKFYGLYMDGYSPKDSINWGFKEMVDGFLTNICGTLNQTPEVVITCRESMPDGVWEVLPQPIKPGAPINYINWGSTAGFSMSGSSEAKQAAWDFIVFIMAPEKNFEYSKEFGYLPVYSSVLQDGYFQSGVLKGFSDTLTAPQNRLLKTDDLSQWGYFLSEYATNEVQMYMSGQQSAEETLATIAAWLKEEYENEHPQ